jgi:MHS family proline/betaine transporter-like MFS transporter
VFPRHVRCSAVSAAYNLSVGLAGGTAPAVATWLIDITGDMAMPAFYIMLCAAISAAAALSIHETRRQALADSVIAT